MFSLSTLRAWKMQLTTLLVAQVFPRVPFNFITSPRAEESPSSIGGVYFQQQNKQTANAFSSPCHKLSVPRIFIQIYTQQENSTRAAWKGSFATQQTNGILCDRSREESLTMGSVCFPWHNNLSLFSLGDALFIKSEMRVLPTVIGVWLWLMVICERRLRKIDVKFILIGNTPCALHVLPFCAK